MTNEQPPMIDLTQTPLPRGPWVRGKAVVDIEEQPLDDRLSGLSHRRIARGFEAMTVDRTPPAHAYPLVELVWEDTQGFSRWRSVKDLAEQEQLTSTIRSAGYLVIERDDVVVVCSAIDVENGDVSSCDAIPRSAVREIRVRSVCLEGHAECPGCTR